VTDYAALVTALYAELGGWQEVAIACNGSAHAFTAGCFWNIAEGKTLKPTLPVRKAILAGVASTPACLSLAVNASRCDLGRKKVWYSDELRDAQQALRLELGETWNQFGRACLEARKRELLEGR